MREISFGVEIETVRLSRKRVAKAIASVVGGEAHHVGHPQVFDPWEVIDDQERTWRVVADASLAHVPSHLRAEVVTPVLAYGDIPILQHVIRAIRRVGARVDSHCGIHVHVDASCFDGRTLGNLAKTVYKQEPLIIAALGVTERRQQNYTRPVSGALISEIERNRPRTTDELNHIWYGYHNSSPQHYDRTRYYGVNLHNVWYRGTVEFRWFEATLHAGKVKSYIQLVLAIATKALNGRAASSRKRRYDSQSARYDFRVFLLHLDMIGDEFRTARKHLLALLPGDPAFRRGRPVPDAKLALDRQSMPWEAKSCNRDPIT